MTEVRSLSFLALRLCLGWALVAGSSLVWGSGRAEAQTYGAVPGPRPVRLAYAVEYSTANSYESSFNVEGRWHHGCTESALKCPQSWGFVGRAYARTDGKAFGELWGYWREPAKHLWIMPIVGVNDDATLRTMLRFTYVWEPVQANFDVVNLHDGDTRGYVFDIGYHLKDYFVVLPAWRVKEGDNPISDGVFGLNLRLFFPINLISPLKPTWLQFRWEPETENAYGGLFVHW